MFGCGVGLGKVEISPGWTILHYSQPVTQRCHGSLKSRDPVQVSLGGPSSYRNLLLLWNTGKESTTPFWRPYPEHLTIPPPLPATYHQHVPPCCQSKGREEKICPSWTTRYGEHSRTTLNASTCTRL